VETELRKIKETRDARMAEMEQHLRMYHQINHVFVGQQDTLVGYQVSFLRSTLCTSQWDSCRRNSPL
jgi:hypothetical protein